ncbi:hypothetical protein QBC36DRAFT_11296 [Triangularia setosa]|uniref:Uncharacterized protein n=1 Tax=Triangularia setosa TaxID=2587417 RepID=A0AAN6WIN0_9PEZI|nr:hypothetical protein QBC36DRAFT_11296 [Podospora setosa]
MGHIVASLATAEHKVPLFQLDAPFAPFSDLYAPLAIMFKHQGRWRQALLNIALVTVFILCYALLIVLYLTPKSYRIKSLLHPDEGYHQAYGNRGPACCYSRCLNLDVGDAVHRAFPLVQPCFWAERTDSYESTSTFHH